MTYETIADKFKENSLNNNFGEYYYLCKKEEYKVLDPWPKFMSFLNNVTCGYGRKTNEFFIIWYSSDYPICPYIFICWC